MDEISKLQCELELLAFGRDIRGMPDTFECGEKTLAVLIKQIPPGKFNSTALVILGMAVVENHALPENEIHLVSYRKEGGQTVRTLHKIFNLEVS